MSEKVSSNELAKMRTALANQRTYLAYTRTGFAVVAIAAKFKSNIVIAVGMLLIAVGVYQYYTIATDIENNKISLPNKEIPLTFTLAGIMAVYYYFAK
jgi:uncharacterized membrane protein YidH (DUF202 family)